VETVTTALHFEGPLDQVWHALLFYEDVPTRPPAFLRLFLPAPLHTTGDKTRVGAIIECTYEGGHLEKRMTAIEPPRRMTFDVTLQALGIEDAISMHGGAYDLEGDPAGGTTVVLSTRYRGHLRPRWLWRPFERYLAHQLHRHILLGVRAGMMRLTALPARHRWRERTRRALP
jgi:hypothetical protein